MTILGGHIILVFSRPLRPTQSGPPWVGAMRTGDGFGQRLGRNGSEFSVAECPAIRTAVQGADC